MKRGLPPGTIVHTGERKLQNARVTMIRFDSDTWNEEPVDLSGPCPMSPDSELTWINVYGLHDTAIIERVGGWFRLHPLEMEDIANTKQRPKREIFDEHILLIVRVFGFCPDSPMDSEQLALVITRNGVVSFQEGDGGIVFDPLKDRMKSAMSRFRKLGSDYLSYAILDAVIDQYFFTLEWLDERIEGMEETLIDSTDEHVLSRIHEQRHQMIAFRRAVWPVRELVAELERAGEPFIGEDTRIYLRDLHDHLIQIIDGIESLRDILSGMIEVHLSSVSNRLNRIMKLLTVISTIFIPLTFLAGVYGMNFEFMPELKWRYGYGLTWLIMLGIAAGMLVMFRRKKWI